MRANALNCARRGAFIGVGGSLDPYETRASTFQDFFADYVRADIDDRGQLAGSVLSILYFLGVSEDSLYPVARGQHPAVAIQNHTSLRLTAPKCLLLFDGSAQVVVGSNGLKVETPPAQRNKRYDQSQQDQDG